MIVFNRTINWLAAMSLAFIVAIVTVFALSPALARLEPMLFRSSPESAVNWVCKIAF